MENSFFFVVKSDRVYYVLTISSQSIATSYKVLFILNDSGDIVYSTYLLDFTLNDDKYDFNGLSLAVKDNKVYHFKSDLCNYVKVVELTLENGSYKQFEYDIENGNYLHAGAWC